MAVQIAHWLIKMTPPPRIDWPRIALALIFVALGLAFLNMLLNS